MGGIWWSLWRHPPKNQHALAGKSPCSIGNTSTHSWWIFQPSHVSFREGIFAKFWVLEKGISVQTMAIWGTNSLNFSRGAWTPRVAPVLNAEKIFVPNRAGLGSCYSDPWSFIIHISHIWKTRWPPSNKWGKIRFLATKKKHGIFLADFGTTLEGTNLPEKFQEFGSITSSWWLNQPLWKILQ